MKFKTLKNGDRMPALGLGTWKAETGEVAKAVRSALEVGYRHFDCAPIYGNEKEIGEAFSQAFAEGTVKREELWVTSKLWGGFHDPEDVREGLEATLRDLRLDHLDLYLVHWPIALKKGVHFPEEPDEFLSPAEMPMTETWKGMEGMLDAGLVRHIGVSNVNPAKLETIAATARHAPEVNQVECHPFLSQPELLATCERLGTILTAYSPLGSGKEKEDDAPDLFENETLAKIAEAHAISPAQTALAWALQRGTTAIPKSTDAGRQKENFQAAEVTLTEIEMTAIDGLNRGYRFIDGTIWTENGSPYSLEWLWRSGAVD